MNENKVFIGARALSEDQIKLILPTYESLKKQIDEIRKAASNKEDNKYKQYNNTISIFGKRGTGKTSILFTILEQLSKQEEINILLPKIEPDLYGDNTKILGAILGFLKLEVDKINNEILSIGNCNELEGFF